MKHLEEKVIKLEKMMNALNDAPLLKKAKIGIDLGIVSIDLTKSTFDTLKSLEKRIAKLEKKMPS